MPHDPEHIAFINRAVRAYRDNGGCGGVQGADAIDATGWYADLFLDPADKVAYDPNIADVHTQPTLVPPGHGVGGGRPLGLEGRDRSELDRRPSRFRWLGWR